MRAVSILWGAILIIVGNVASAEEYIKKVKVTASSEQVKGYTSAEHIISNQGLTEVAPGIWELSDQAKSWNSAYLPVGSIETPLLDFDFDSARIVKGFRVWNANGAPHRGFRSVSIYASEDGKVWRTIQAEIPFAKAPGKPGYRGEMITFSSPVKARFLRFWCEGTHRTGGQPDIASLGKVRFVEAAGEGKPAVAAHTIFPTDAGIVNVKDPLYGARGDGVHDDTLAIQKAIDATQGTHRYVYLPKGVYLVSKSLTYRNAYRHGHSSFRGDGPDNTVLKLQDGIFTDPAKPQAVLFNGVNGTPGGRVSADWFHNHFSDFRIDTGKNNPGAIALQYYSNNLGRLSNVHLISGDGQGVIGLDLAHADQNGPHLIKNVRIQGFETGIRVGGTVNSQTLEQITILQPKKVGLINEGQCLTVRGFRYEGEVPAVQSRWGVLTLIDADCRGTAGAKDLAAITSGETLFARNITAAGFRTAIDNQRQSGTPSPKDVKVTEFVSSEVIARNRAKPESLNLPVRETPDTPVSDPSTWANVRHYRLITDADDSASVERALAAPGVKVIYFPRGSYTITQSIKIPAKIIQIAGMFSQLRTLNKKDHTPPSFVLEAGEQVLFVEDLFSDLGLVNPRGRTLVVRNVGMKAGSPEDRGELYLENFVGDWTFGKGQRVWARQLNTETEGTHLVNAGAELWILGLKTERGGILIDTTQGGKTEVLGGLCYTTTKGKLGPMFRVMEGELSVTLGEVCYTGDPYRTLVEWQENGTPKTLLRGDALLRASFLQGSCLPLVRVKSQATR